jgi:hypothetical protein
MSRHPPQAVMRCTGSRCGPDGRESRDRYECARDCERPMRWSHSIEAPVSDSAPSAPNYFGFVTWLRLPPKCLLTWSSSLIDESQLEHY